MQYRFVENILKAAHGIFPDISCDVLDMIAEDGKVAARIRFRGAHSGEIYGMRATYKTVEWEALEIFRLENGIILESWGYWPGYEMTQMLSGK